MHRRVISFLTSLLVHTSPPSFQDSELLGSLKTTEMQHPKNADLAIGLARAFKGGEFEMGGSDMFHSSDTNIVPFVFPILTLTTWIYATKLSKGTGIDTSIYFQYLGPNHLYIVTVSYKKVVQARPPLNLLFPTPEEMHGAEWEDSPQDWFVILLGAIMPGAIVNVHKI